MVVQTDKVLGPGAIDPQEYVRYSTRDHLGDKRTYQRLTPAAASYCAIKEQKMLESGYELTKTGSARKRENFFARI